MRAPSQLGTNQSDMRAYNEKLVLTLIRREGPLARASIAKRTGLSAQTASVIVRELEDQGLLIRQDPIRGRVGQPSVPLSLSPDAVHAFGLSIGRRSCELVLVNFLGEAKGHLRQRYPFPTAQGIEAFAKEGAKKLTRTLEEDARDSICGMGIAMPFELWNWAAIIGVDPGEMEHWRDCDIAAGIGANFAFPVYMQNDASAACGAELNFGESETPANYLYFYVGYFIGGGVVLGRRLFTGPFGNAGAMGALLITNPEGQSEQLLEMSSIASLEKLLKSAGEDTEFLWRNLEDWGLEPEIESRWIGDMALGLAQAIISSCAVIDFEAVLIDGWMPPRLRARLAGAVRGAITQFPRSGIQEPQILEGSMGRRARALGAASLPLAKRYLVEF